MENILTTINSSGGGLAVGGKVIAKDSTQDIADILENIDTLTSNYNNCVKTTGNQSISGTKTFNSNIVINTTPTANNHAIRKADLEAKGLKKLWENPNPNSAFAGQQIKLSNSDWDYIICVGNFFRSYTNAFGNKVVAFAPKGYGFTFNASGNFGIGGNYNNVAAYMRLFDYISDTRYDAKECNVAVNVDPYDFLNQNGYLIPLVIYGGKF